MEKQRTIALVIVLLLIAGSIAYLELQKPKRVSSKEAEISLGNFSKIALEKEKLYPRAKEIVNPSGFVNADNFTIAENIGKKVILVDFWTYSCINCQRTIPYLNAWYDKYKSQGLEIIGVHTPEFEFEKDYSNVQAAVKKFGIKYPVVLDNDRSTWAAYQNLVWPREYLIDIDGFVVYDHIGEGNYDESEMKIQEALKERMERLNIKENISAEVSKPAEAIDVNFEKVKSPEVYFGAARNEYLANGKQGTLGLQNLPEPPLIQLNNLYLTGQWNFEGEYAVNQQIDEKIIFRYDAKNAYMVASAAEEVELEIKKDGKFVKKIKVKDEQLYDIITGDDYGEHTLEITVDRPGLKAYTFTFG